MGVGFDRGVAGSTNGIASPRDDALLRLSAPGSGDYAPGYIISAQGIRLGLSSSQTSGFTTVPLTPSSTEPGDWRTAPGTVAITAGSDAVQPVSVTLLMDTGIGEMFINAATGPFPGGLSTGDSVQITSVHLVSLSTTRVSGRHEVEFAVTYPRGL